MLPVVADSTPQPAASPRRTGRDALPRDDRVAPLELQLSHFLESEINPTLGEHQGSVVLESIEHGDTALLKFGGSCHGCGQADLTLSEFIAVKIQERFPVIRKVNALATMHR
ncbi:NifU family protein [Azoarcus sp. KH32C]|uniref:NifU family protein n=1 Tax=Azoarcus sp. KH32C TaxID=748247 RepID=UPI0002385B9F|nr:NifU family protein [Azoarcus sp. KH32C]BAL27282.1 hypothetical protein AZKH_p0399 [Azoarcus sp. KH32C]